MRTGFITVVVFSHALVVLFAFSVASWIRFGDDSGSHLSKLVTYPALGIVGYVALALGLFGLSGLYRFDDRWTVSAQLRDSTRAVAALGVVTLAMLFLFQLPPMSRIFLTTFFILVWAGITLTTIMVRSFYAHRRATGKGVRHVLVVGTNPAVVPFVNDLMNNHPELGVRVAGYVGRGPGLLNGVPYLGQTDLLSEVLATRIIDEVVIAPRSTDLDHLDDFVRISHEQGKTVRIPLPSMGYSISKGDIEVIDGTPLLTVPATSNRQLCFALKRVVDIGASTVALIVLFPLMLIVAVVVLLTDGRPVIYADARAGIHGRPMRIHKFRTMVTNADDLRAELAEHNDRVGPDFKVLHDPRITRVGSFLRRTSLDELPQFWDILVGHISLVGPRAQRLDEVAGYDAWHRRRLSVKPGLTGLWQVRARQDPSFDVRATLDLEYIDNWSLALDLRIVLETIPAILRLTGS